MVKSSQWIGNICKKLEDMCVGVDEEIAVMSANVKQFCSDFMQEMLPSSSSEDVTEESDLDSSPVPDSDSVESGNYHAEAEEVEDVEEEKEGDQLSSVENVGDADLFDSGNYDAETEEEEDQLSFVETVAKFMPWARDESPSGVKSVELDIIASEDPQSPLEVSGFFTPVANDSDVALSSAVAVVSNEKIDPESWEKGLNSEYVADDGSNDDAFPINIEKPNLDESCIPVENGEPSSKIGKIVEEESVVEKPCSSSSIPSEPFDWEFSDWEIVPADNFPTESST